MTWRMAAPSNAFDWTASLATSGEDVVVGADASDVAELTSAVMAETSPAEPKLHPLLMILILRQVVGSACVRCKALDVIFQFSNRSKALTASSNASFAGAFRTEQVPVAILTA